METYSFLRELADSWGLLAMFVLFLGVVAWVFRPGSRKMQDDAARSIFRNDSRPAEAAKPQAKEA
ncbi:cbb3-type cytochrome c oxidase subunit 3 [Rhodobacter sp. Har01]|uniref:cbb3-type cytochrome c oxidase subunit 3 n=1 Tax=Rhodobacter sp. Har01 TaxID=2883999 RepID=UPI001D060FFB|nr:cbb3-type cytochrome c oxidase subunit 3 [Rhodobacter sp. Har01]MCB6179570.1 cbb3-type cytochrome c oxidase subunit 3 [Rhodobacter sp. Har01]